MIDVLELVVKLASDGTTLAVVGLVAAVGIVVAYVVGFGAGSNIYGYPFGGMMGPGQGMMMGQTPAQNRVIISDYAFHPATLVVKKGTTVYWLNMDFVSHTIESGTHEAPTEILSSNLLGHMESFSFTFKKLGTYVYHCDPHPYMAGEIIVEG